MMHFLRSTLLALLLVLTGCGSEHPCSTFEGPALWTGKCEQGLAQGDGLATFEDSYIATLKGHFTDGVPSGEVAIIYSQGGSYHGEIKNGEPHGFGIDIEPWGEGFEGNWVDGWEEGEGVYIGVDGTRIDGVWRRGNLVGAWYTDPETACELWWSADENPTGTASWNGNCVDGKADGAGTVMWTANAEDVAAATGNEVTFNGILEGGVVQGQGKWRQTLEYTNVTHFLTIEGHWDSGELNGAGKYEKISRFKEERGLSKVVTTYNGEFGNGELSGEGRREEVKEYLDARFNRLIEEGQFADNMLNGEGVRIEERTDPNGNRHDERAQDRFSDREFRGYGEQMIESHFANERYVARLNYPSDIGNGGNGTIGYSDGDLFEGNIDAWGTPVDGVCQLASVDYSGPCVARSHKTSDFSGVTCLVSPKEEKKCLKEISSWVS